MGVVIASELPALPLHTAGKYVAGAYVVFFAIVLIYVAIMAVRLKRVERDVGELLERDSSALGTHTEIENRESTPV
jgi:isoprenylcysteine carboxyl methyltransferase (ICMT) family protein YpbQ